MRRVGRFIVVLAAGLVCAAAAPGQPPQGDRRPGDEAGRRRPQPGQLLPGPVQEQLKLTADQKKQVEEIQKDVDAKIREAQEKLDKILTEDQKKALREMRERGGRFGRRGASEGRGQRPEQPRGGAEGRERRPDAPARRPEGEERRPAGPDSPPRGAGGPPRPGQILPGPLQEQLRLTAEQKKQIEDLQKDVDAKLDKILTEDQKKELRELRERGGRPGAPRGGRPEGDRPQVVRPASPPR